MKLPKQLNCRTKYWGKYSFDGGLHTITVKVPKGFDLSYVQARYYCSRSGPGGYFSCPISIRHVKRREYVLEVRFGWDC